MELHLQAETISTREDLSRFIFSLREDLLANEASWENPTLERFLEAFGAWTKDMQGAFRNKGEPIPDQPSWRPIGEMLFSATMYE